MNCEYWKDIVLKLYDISQCNWASHVLSTGLLNKVNLAETNLGAALKCVSEEEIIRGVIYAYSDWSAQPYCDLVLEQFDRNKILPVFNSIESPGSNLKLGVEGFFQSVNENP